LKFKDNTRLSEESLEIIDHLRNVGSYEGVYLFFGHDTNIAENPQNRSVELVFRSQWATARDSM